MSDDVTAEALRMACLELAGWRYWYAGYPAVIKQPSDVAALVEEFKAKATGFGSEEA